jgi:hypothetical protein
MLKDRVWFSGSFTFLTILFLLHLLKISMQRNQLTDNMRKGILDIQNLDLGKDNTETGQRQDQ